MVGRVGFESKVSGAKMAGRFGFYIDMLLQRRVQGRWAALAERAQTLDLETLRGLRGKAARITERRMD